MNTLLVGFDSAWTPTNPGAIAGLLRREDGTVEELMPEPARFGEAIDIVRRWQADSGSPAPTTVIMIDQPTIVTNERRQRDVAWHGPQREQRLRQQHLRRRRR